MRLNRGRVREQLAAKEFERLFVEELGWDRHRQRLTVEADGCTFALRSFAHKRGFVAFHCPPPEGGSMPEYAVRRKIEWRVARQVREHLIVYTGADGSEQRWQWVKRERGESAKSREWPYYRGQSGEVLIEKLEVLAVPLPEEEDLTLVDITERAQDAFDVDTVSQQFYRHFKNEHDKFYEAIDGIAADEDREWYTSLMLNRLMFVYFIQKKGFLDGNTDYLRTRLRMVRERVGEGEFLSFYRHFLLRLFYEGLGTSPDERTGEFDELLGDIPYLNGGLFLPHPLEDRYAEIAIPDEAFADLFDFFDQYHWHLDLRPLQDDHEINPDVLGYIFEQFVNQKQMGAYYTKEDITGHMASHSVGAALVDRLSDRVPKVVGQDGSGWSLIAQQPERYLPNALAHGVEHDLPDEIRKGIEDPAARELWSAPADDSERALVTETWREVVDRRRSYRRVRSTMENGEVRSADAMVSRNLPVDRWLRDVIEVVEDPAFVEHVWAELERLAVCDIACGSGAFLFAPSRCSSRSMTPASTVWPAGWPRRRWENVPSGRIVWSASGMCSTGWKDTQMRTTTSLRRSQ